MKIIKGSDKGFFAVSNDTARHISHSVANNEEWFINWGKETPYYDSSEGENVWEYYFQQTYSLKPTNNVVSDYTDLVKLKPTFRETMHFLYTNYFILNKKLNELLTPHFELFEEKNILGIHIRRTDKFLIGMYGTTQKTTPVDLSLFKKEIDLIHKDYEYIFLATDCNIAKDFIKNEYGSKVIFNRDAFRSSTTKSIHHSYKNISGYRKGLDILTDVFLLSKCKHLIRSSSNASVTALYLNLNLTQLNLNEKYSDDSENEILL